MSGQIFLFDPTERFVVGTVGIPGERTFFLQARTGSRLISVSLEKAQVAALADRIQQILREVRSSEPLTIFERIVRDDAPLETPIDEEFRVGVIGLAYVSDRKLIEIDLQAMADSQSAEDEEALMEISESQDILRVLISLGYAESFAKRALAVVGAGRAPCPFCGGPIDPSGHLCPRANGYKR
ncbi:MAG: DUF3090 family protein [Actinobacteria bacterium]|uniref:Unannotated protein n=1 Tax=freshwater metagenome TaxID=449393 RepID=A0A6J7U890_9ZZZZ|nr:DUF3090 family protein [Actinomycetota bacterium]MTA49570.1 DUF3090 family protein [Actinomycetota bacterium]